MYRPQVLFITNLVILIMHRPLSLLTNQIIVLMHSKIFVRTLRRRKRRKIMSHNRHIATAQVCYYHQNFGEKARLCSEPCSYYSTLGQREVANLALSHSKLLYVADKGHKCKYLIDTGAAVSVLPKSCANGISDANSLPLVAANDSTINTYGNCKRVVDVGLKREYPWTL